MTGQIAQSIIAYNDAQSAADREICSLLAVELTRHLPGAENKIWHAHPVWLLEGNPVAGYSKQKGGIRLMFWSGSDFGEPALNILGKKFKDAAILYHSADAIDLEALKRWLEKSVQIQWDYKNLVKRKGKLERLK